MMPESRITSRVPAKITTRIEKFADRRAFSRNEPSEVVEREYVDIGDDGSYARGRSDERNPDDEREGSR